MNFLTTAIGSMPYTDSARAAQVSLNMLDAPLCPQLPRRDPRERMEVQYSGGMPRAVLAGERLFFETNGDYSEEFALFYESYISAREEDEFPDFAVISPEYSGGITVLENALQDRGGKMPWLKVQVTGPCTFALTVTDQTKRSIYYNEEFRDMVIKTLAEKCRWQIRRFARFSERVMCFIDEPVLSAFGSSSYVSVRREDVVSELGEVIDAIHDEGALAAVHCCGNTEWSIVTDAGADIVSFDAFSFAPSIAVYTAQISDLLKHGGMLAWGIVPTSKIVREQTVESLETKLEEGFSLLTQAGIDKERIISQSILTPSCGTGTLSEADSDRVFELLHELSKRMKQKYA